MRNGETLPNVHTFLPIAKLSPGALFPGEAAEGGGTETTLCVDETGKKARIAGRRAQKKSESLLGLSRSRYYRSLS